MRPFRLSAVRIGVRMSAWGAVMDDGAAPDCSFNFRWRMALGAGAWQRFHNLFKNRLMLIYIN